MDRHNQIDLLSPGMGGVLKREHRAILVLGGLGTGRGRKRGRAIPTHERRGMAGKRNQGGVATRRGKLVGEWMRSRNGGSLQSG